MSWSTRTRRRTILTALAVTLLVVSCGAAPTNLPTHKDWHGSSPTALQSGRLVLSGECVSLVDDRTDGSWLIVWQPGTSRNGNEIVDQGGRLLAHIDDQVSIGGGEYDQDSIGSQLAAPIPSSCQTDSYWLVGQVTVDGPGGAPAPT